MSKLKGFASILVFVLLGLAGGELGARIDDRVFEGIPLASNPTFAGLFFTLDDDVRRGRPGARWKRVQLNNLGTRGPDVPLQRTPGCERWLFIGASETFGEPSIEGGDFPSHVRALIPAGRCVEIVNSASPGMGPQAVIRQYEAYLRQLRADKVFVYLSTHFYLDEVPAAPLPPAAEPPPAQRKPPPGTLPPASGEGRGFGIGRILGSSRLFERLRDSAEVPAPLQRWRTQRWIDAELAKHPPDWPYTAPPAPRLDALERELTALLAMIRAAGSEPVLITHAVRTANPPRPEDMGDLFAMRAYVPRAPEQVFAAFDYLAAERVRRVGAAQRVRVVDVARELSGRRELFIDAIHFAPDGNEAVAQLICAAVACAAPTGSAHAVQ